MAWWPRRSGARDGIQDDVRDELASHVELRIKDNLRRGMTPVDAGREAATRFGPVAAVAVDCARIQRRRESRARSIWLDVRASWLGWRRSPWISLLGAVVGAIGLSTALAAALLADAAFLRQPPGMTVDERVFTVLSAGDGQHAQLMSYDLARRLAAAAPEHEFFLWQDEEFQINAGGRSGIWSGVYACGDYFTVLGVGAAAGRLLERADEIDRRPVAVISSALARQLFGSIAGAPGQTLRVNGRSMDVVGVAGLGFRGGTSTRRADIWLPVTTEALIAVESVLPNGQRVRGLVNQPGIGWLFGGVRLASVDARTSVTSRYTAAIRALPRSGPATAEQDLRAALLFDRAWISPFSYERQQLAAVLKPVGLAVALTLLLAAACMSSLLVGRLAHRQQEIAVRLALGASRGRVLRLVVAEHVMAIAAAAALATPLTLAIFATINRLQIASDVRVASIAVTVDGRGLLILLILSGILGVASLVGPLAFARATAGAAGITGARVVSSGTTLRRALMAAQVATGCALLAAGGLLTRTIDHLLAQPRGFDAAQVAYVEVDLAKAGFDEATRAGVLDALRARVRTSDALALTTGRPYAGIEYEWMFVDVPDRASTARSELAMLSRIDGPYFEALGIRVVAGRLFTESSRARREAIVSETFADYYWPGQNAIGRTFRGGGKKEIHEVVGVVGRTNDLTLRGPSSRLYLPLDDDTEKLFVVARRAQPRVAAETELTSLVSQVDSRLSPTRTGVLEDLALRTLEQRRVIRWMTLVVGTGSLLMVGVGVWGLAHTSVTRRWREFGLRLALGAERRVIAQLALRDAIIVSMTGIGLGLVAAWQLGRALGGFLVGVSPADPLVLATSALILAGAVFAGAWLPARRAARADPSHLLRTS